MWPCTKCRRKFRFRGELFIHSSKANCDNESPSILGEFQATYSSDAEDQFMDDSEGDPSFQPVESSSDEENFIMDLDRPLEPIEAEILVPQDKASGTLCGDLQEVSVGATENDGMYGGSPRERSPTISGKQETTVEPRKRVKGVRRREEEMKKKELGLPYMNRKGKKISVATFVPVEECCREKCFSRCPPQDQDLINSQFRAKSKAGKHEVLCGRLSVSMKLSERKGRGISDKTKNRQHSASYHVVVNGERIRVCKRMFCHVHGITVAQTNHLIKKLIGSPTGLVDGDRRGKHPPKNKLEGQREEMKSFIERYPRHASHYSRRDTLDKIFLPSHLNIAKMYDEYKKEISSRPSMSRSPPHAGSYDVFREVFKSTGFRFKQPYVDTCKKCDEYKTRKKLLNQSSSSSGSASSEELEVLTLQHEQHLREAEKAYDSKRSDKDSAMLNHNERVLVFDLQQVLSTPHLSTNIVYYKRLLSTYNLTVRECSSEGETHCFMWHEAVGGRGADQIASCVFKKIMTLPDEVSHVKTYSDTCGGQNRNAYVAAMFSYAMEMKPSIQVIDQKFLLPGHTRLECDSDHARIERAKKRIGNDLSIMTPRDWYSFVRHVPGKRNNFRVYPMATEDFYAFSRLFDRNSHLIRRYTDTDGQKVEWLNIKWLRYSRPFGLMEFKYDLDEETPFRRLDFRRVKRGRPASTTPPALPRSYDGPVPINPLKKRDLLSILSLIDSDCHHFYETLTTSGEAPEFDELSDGSDSEEV